MTKLPKARDFLLLILLFSNVLFFLSVYLTPEHVALTTSSHHQLSQLRHPGSMSRGFQSGHRDHRGEHHAGKHGKHRKYDVRTGPDLEVAPHFDTTQGFQMMHSRSPSRGFHDYLNRVFASESSASHGGFHLENCKVRERPRQLLVFFHVFKTAGSTVRDMLREVAVAKGCGVAMVRYCAEEKVGSDEPCEVKDIRYRDSVNEVGRGRWMHRENLPLKGNEEVVRDNVAVVGGHISADFIQDAGYELQDEDIGKIMFVRSPLQRLVSGVLYTIDRDSATNVEELTTEDMLVALEKEVVHYERNYAGSIYGKYLLTREQRKEVGGDALSETHAVLATMKTMAMVGVVEDWELSINMLQKILVPERCDRTMSSRALERCLKNRAKVKKAVRKQVAAKRNKSKGRGTDEWVKAVEAEDKALYDRLMHMLRWEEIIWKEGKHLLDAAVGKIVQELPAEGEEEEEEEGEEEEDGEEEELVEAGEGGVEEEETRNEEPTEEAKAAVEPAAVMEEAKAAVEPEADSVA